MVSLSEFVLKINFKNDNQVINLHNVDPADIDDVLLKIQRSFDIRFDQEDLDHVKTFGNLCDAVVKKLKDRQSDNYCTTQHAFYMLRNAINISVDVNKEFVKPQTKLCDIFPRDTRLQVIAEIESELGFKMNLLKPKPAIVFIFSLILGASFIGFFFFPVIAGIGALLAITGLVLAGKFGKEMPVKTLGDLAEKISKEHYRNCRRNAQTVNRHEVAEKVKQLFTHGLYLEPQVVRREAKF
jgi:acyl carrier protein